MCFCSFCVCMLYSSVSSVIQAALFNVCFLTYYACLFMCILSQKQCCLTCLNRLCMYGSVFIPVSVCVYVCVAVQRGSAACFLTGSGPVDSSSAPSQAREQLYVLVKSSCRNDAQRAVCVCVCLYHCLYVSVPLCLSDSRARLLLQRQILKTSTSSSFALCLQTINFRHLKNVL